MRGRIATILEGRPGWMNGVMLFCFYMALLYMPFDFILKHLPLPSLGLDRPIADSVEVWFGVMLTGWAAKATEPLHWLIYAAGAYGFLHMRSWLWPWASIYVAQVAFGMFLWTTLEIETWGWLLGLVAAAPFTILALALWRARERFHGPSAEPA